MAEESVFVGGNSREISHSPAILMLEELLQEGQLTDAQLEYFKGKYSKLHDAVLKTYENESRLLEKAKQLNAQFTEGKQQLEQVGSRDHEIKEEIEELKAEAAKAETEVAICEERDAMLHLEIGELERQKKEIQQEKEDKEREVAEALAPRLQALQASIDELTGEANRNRELVDSLNFQKGEYSTIVDGHEVENEKLRLEIDDAKSLSIRVRGDPGKVRKQADLGEITVKSFHVEVENINRMVERLDQTLLEQSTRKKQIEESRQEAVVKLEQQRTAIDQKERIADDISRNVDNEKEQAAIERETALQIDVELRSLQAEQKRHVENLHRREKEKEDAVKQFRKNDLILGTLKGTIPNLTGQREELQRQLALCKTEKKTQLKQLEELNRDVDVFINNFLQEEALEKEKAAYLTELVKENKAMEAELAELSAQSYALGRQIFDLGSRRDAKARELAKCIDNTKDTNKEIKVKEIVILDLSKRSQEMLQRLKEYTTMYEVVKNERNKYVNLIQASQQAAAEMKEKIGILQNEIDILHNESVTKDKALGKEKAETQQVTQSRDQLRSDANRSLFQYREKQELVDQQIAEIDKLNSIINGLEKDMLRLKKQYEVAVEERNYTGIQLIDRNDELCILYEKSNIQEQILHNGEVEYNRREDEIRVLHLEAKRLTWKNEVTAKLLPKVPEFKKSIFQLKEQLQQEKKLADKLSLDLETPANQARWRPLEGKDLDHEELTHKIAELEERLNDKKEQLLEKELVLEEVGALTDRLRKQATEGREETVDLAKRVNDMQARIKAMTRKTMACVSELSMYQATAIKLESEKKTRQKVLEEAVQRFEQGEAPTEDAEKEWHRFIRDREMREMEAQRQMEDERGLRVGGSGTCYTMAEARPNAYIPNDLELPRPYGAHAPFKPSEPGTTMRHIVKPSVREIIL